MTDLDGATDIGAEGAYAATPGQFAARWNARTEGKRQRYVEGIIENSIVASRCFEIDHEAELTYLRQELRIRIERIENAIGYVEGWVWIPERQEIIDTLKGVDLA